MRTLIYARYSSTLQNDRSIEDQVALCYQRAAREGWTVVETFSDRATSGAAGIDTGKRPGMEAMLARIARGGIEQVLAESTDRLSRHQGDSFALREQLEEAGVRLFTLHDGVVDDINGTIKGLFDARFRKDLASRVKRGQQGSIRAGRAVGGVAYGYRRVIKLDDNGEPIRGLREIDPDKAHIVERIYREYVRGDSPMTISARLNAEGVPPPRRGVWHPATITGSNGFGILVNPIYAGVIVYGRTRQVLDRKTRVKRMKPGRDELLRGEAPHLRIISPELWDAVQEELAKRRSPRPERQRRPKHVLSGLGKCGVCGEGNWILTRSNYWGCSHAARGKACTNRRLVATDQYERQVLEGLKGQMLAPEAVKAYVQEYHREHARLTADTGKARAQLTRQLADADRKLANLVAAIADGGGAFSELRNAMATARETRDRLAQELASIDAIPVLQLHPGLADRYRREVEELEMLLADKVTKLEAMPRIRALISEIIVTPSDAKRGVAVEVRRKADEMVKLASGVPLRDAR
ncbi:recombinase family protein [Sphingomonas sp. 2378]|uniref:recombinase family protein n=1 Tax=Sphingomonas sp. 2378 TaxID=1219748 RepID=UPI00311AC713